MEKHNRFLAVSFVLIGMPFLVSCAGLLSQRSPKEPLTTTGPLQIHLKSTPGTDEVTEYFSHSLIDSFEEMQQTRHKEELVEFTVNSRAMKVEAKGEVLHFRVSILKKDGLVDLRDLAFPEEGEVLDMVYTKEAEVVLAGGYPKSSVFYVPPLSLPREKVEVGDTWEMKRSWVGLRNGVPLEMRIVTVLKNIYSCGKAKERCADLDISGDVSVPGLSDLKMSFSSQINGRMIFALDRGAVVWSLVRSEESMTTQEGRMHVRSCIVAKTIRPKDSVWDSQAKVSCDPKQSEIVVPGL